MGLLTIGLLKLMFHINGNYFLLGGNSHCLGRLRYFGYECWLRFAFGVLAVSVVGAWYVNLVGNDRANIFDDRRTMVVQIDIHIVVQLSKVVVFT